MSAPDSDEDVGALDEILLDALADDILTILLAPPTVPSFVRETVRPMRAS